MKIGKNKLQLMSNQTGEVAESLSELIRIIWLDRTHSLGSCKPFWNLSWKLLTV